MFPQLFNGDIDGEEGSNLGLALPIPPRLVHPFTVWVTEYAPATLTVMSALLLPVDHNIEPLNPVAVRIEYPHWSFILTNGADGTGTGDEITLSAALTHPLLAVWVAVYVPDGTVMEAVPAPVLHKRLPVYALAVSTLFPQLFITDNVGLTGTTLGSALPVWGALVHPLVPVCVTV